MKIPDKSSNYFSLPALLITANQTYSVGT